MEYVPGLTDLDLPVMPPGGWPALPTLAALRRQDAARAVAQRLGLERDRVGFALVAAAISRAGLSFAQALTEARALQAFLATHRRDHPDGTPHLAWLFANWVEGVEEFAPEHDYWWLPVPAPDSRAA